MSRKVLVADDSQTIQKVIKITFANQDFDITPVLDESELFNAEDSFDLILLDFGLSDDGYALGQRTREKFPNTPILALLGTFDIVDETKLRNSGFSDKVVKPFETEKFISLCNDMIGSEVQSISQEDYPNEDSNEAEDDNFSGWDVDSSLVQAEAPSEEDHDHEDDKTVEFDLSDHAPLKDEDNNLESELDGWGFDPTNLKGSDVTGNFDTLPPVIEASEEIDTQDEFEEGPESPTSVLDVSSFVGNLDDELDEDFEIPAQSNIDELDEMEEVPMEALSTFEDDSDDFEEISDDNLWDVDEDMSQTFSSETEDEHEIDISNNQSMNDDFSFGSTKTTAHIKSAVKAPALDMEALKNDLRSEIGPVIEKYAREYCEQNIEKIIWEIVPDLAENLIKKELKNISKQVLTSISE